MSTNPTSSQHIYYFQDAMDHNHCYGCGRVNTTGLRIRSRWDDEDPELSICEFNPMLYHSAYPQDVVNGGIIATLIDCHSICTSIAAAYRRAGRAVGEGQSILYVTGSLQVRYIKPTPISSPLRVVGRIVEVGDRTTKVESNVYAQDGTQTAVGEVTAVVAPASWANPDGLFPIG